MNTRKPSSGSNEFAGIKNEQLLFILYLVKLLFGVARDLVQEVRLAAEAAFSSRWVTWWCVAGGASAGVWLVRSLS